MWFFASISPDRRLDGLRVKRDGYLDAGLVSVR
jgi:hypothetical protein